MLKVCIIDDEMNARNTLKSLIQNNDLSLEICGEADNVAPGIRLLNKVSPDLLFLDIQMQDGTGFDLLDEFPNPPFRIVFTTAYDEFALRAFKYNAVDYLIKPIDPDELVKAVKRIEQTKEAPIDTEQLAHLLDLVKTERFDKIALNTTEGLIFLMLEEIIRLESSSNYSIFYTQDGQKVIVSRTLKEFEHLLPKTQFFRVHQSHIINLNYVGKILKEDGGYALTQDQAKVPIARRRKDQLISLLKKGSL